MAEHIDITPLGQTGFRFKFLDTVIYIDPYLSNSVQDNEGPDHFRLQKPKFLPEDINDANYILITHEHLDHCDPDTLGPIYENSPNCVFVCPKIVAPTLINYGIPKNNIKVAHNKPLLLGDFEVLPTPSAHPNIEIDPEGYSRFIGYIIKCGEKSLYHAGDTAVHDEVIKNLLAYGHIDVGFLPVNEQNYYRKKQGIIGNMSVREAFQFSEDIGLKVLVPTHWDMFPKNQVFKEEIEIVYKNTKPTFLLNLNPTYL